MKKNFKFSVFIVIFLSLFLPRLNADSQSPPTDTQLSISMDFKDADLKDVLKVFSMQSGLNFMASEAVQDRKITLYLDKVPIGKTMDKLFKANNLSYDLDKEANIFLVKDWGRPEIETVTEVFYLKYATVSSSSLREEMAQNLSQASKGGDNGEGGQGGGKKAEEKGKWAVEQNAGITKAIRNLLSKSGSLIEDFRTNSLIVTDMPSRMSMISKTIAALDVPVPQIILEVEMMDVSRNTLEKIGLKFGDISDYPNILTATFTGPSRKTNFPLASYSKGAMGAFTQGTVSLAGTYQVLLSFIRAQTDTKYLARPRLLTLNNEPAEIKITTQEVTGEVITYDQQGNVQARTAERAETGVSLRVTPQVNLERNEITMFIMPRVSEASVSAFSTSYRDPEERLTKSMVKAKDGETVIIGGLIRNDSSETVTKLPILGDLPIVGRLFSHRNKERGRERELIVLITPHIVRDTALGLARTKKAVSLEREQDAIPAINRDALMSDYLNNCEKKVIE